ncbi:MAG: hypothetical protein OXD31_02160 [Chloroflexi bacterium]|nr:hypothetical protein [Chloroflexota bacterium]
MAATLFVEAFGKLRKDVNSKSLISDEEDLYSVFRARSDSMGWSASSERPSLLLWGMNEAEVTGDADSSRIGWVQVGLQAGGTIPAIRTPHPIQGSGFYPFGLIQEAREPSFVLPALIQCLYDALSRFGQITLDGFQVTAQYLGPMKESSIWTLVSALNWFNTVQNGNEQALVMLDANLIRLQSEAELLASLRYKNTGSFNFGPVVNLPEGFSVRPGIETPIRHLYSSGTNLAISVRMPEWTASAAAWVLALVIDTARSNAPSKTAEFTVRLMRA